MRSLGDAVPLTPRRSPRIRERSKPPAPDPAHGTTPARPNPAAFVFPKTDYTYSKFSKFHREISPGVMTAPNMSRPGVHSFQGHGVEHKLTPQLLSYPDDGFGSDSDEVDSSRSAFSSTKGSLYSQQERPSLWARVRSIIQTFLMSVISLIIASGHFVTERGSRIFSQQKRPVHMPRTLSAPRYYSYSAHQETLSSRVRSSVHSFFSKIYLWINQTLVWDTWLLNSVRTSWRSSSRTRHMRRSWLIPFLLLVSLILFLGWWFWEDVSLSSVSNRVSKGLEQTREWIRVLLEFPWNVLQSLLSLMWIFVSSPVSLVVSSFPSLESLGVLYDIIYSPLWLVQSIWGLFTSFAWTFVSLGQMATSPIPSTKENTWEVSMDQLTQSAVSEAQSDTLKVFMEAALQKQEASLLTKMSEHEKSLRAEIAAKEGYGQQLGAKVAYLQDELRRLKRRILTCCRRSDAASTAASKENLQEELKKLLTSPEGLVLLGAAAAHSSYSLEKSPSNSPRFNDSEIRAWVSTAFLDKDDFEKALANITKYFHEELERRSSMLMAASTEEINTQIASQMQTHLNQLSKLKSELFQSNQIERDYLQTSATFSATALDESRVQRIIDSAIALYDADKTGMADYALESQGGQVISTRCTETYQVKSPTLSVFGVPLWYPSNSPRTVIQPGMHPGECWAFVGSQGFLVIQLSHRIRVKGFTYEHISPVLLPTGKMDSAPKEFSVNGLRSEGDTDPILLGNYHYLENGTSMQYFPVQRAGVQPLQLIEIQVKSNHGNINYTCMYRFRVHGSIA